MKCVILLVLLALTAAYVVAEDAPVCKVGTCQCAAFKDDSNGQGEPLVSKTPGFKVPCTDAGKEDCRKMCTALAEAAKAKIPRVICEMINMDHEGLKPAAYYKACDAPEWSYTGLTSPDPFCCHEGEPVECNTP